MKKINFKHITTIIFFSIIIIRAYASAEGYYFRTWLEQLTLAYQAFFLFVVIIVIPFFYSLTRRSMLFKIAGFIGVLFLILIYFFILFGTNTLDAFDKKEYYTHRNGQEAIAVVSTNFLTIETRYYEPANIFFMKGDPDNPDIEYE